MKRLDVICAIMGFFGLVQVGFSGINDNLISHWSFDEGEGAQAFDSSGFNNTGEILGASWVDGVSGTALSFDGLDDYVRVPDQPSQQISTNQLTISMWFNLGSDVGATQARLICKQEYDNTANAWGLEIFGEGYGGNTGNQLAFHDSDGSSYDVFWSGALVETGQWHHVSVTDDAGLIKFYLDGQLVSTRINGYGIPQEIPSQIMIGRTCYNPWGATFYYNGFIDEVRLYDRVLDASEIDELASIPEPATFTIFGVGAFLLKRGKRR